jgi:hypothetical protein
VEVTADSALLSRAYRLWFGATLLTYVVALLTYMVTLMAYVRALMSYAVILRVNSNGVIAVQNNPEWC